MQEMQETQVQSPSWEDPLEEEMATQFSILARKIPWNGIFHARNFLGRKIPCQEELGRLCPSSHKELDTNAQLNTHERWD